MRKLVNKLTSKQGSVVALLTAFGVMTLPVLFMAQVPSSNPPYNVDIGAVITNTNALSGTVNSAAQTNLDKIGLQCMWVATASSSTTSTTFAIQAFDAASGQWFSLLTSSAIVVGSAVSSPVVSVLSIRPGIQTTSLPTNMAAFNGQVPRGWRIQQVTAGSGTAQAVTGTVGCNLTR